MRDMPGPPQSELDLLLRRSAPTIRAAAVRLGLAGDDLDEVTQLVRIRLWRAVERGGGRAIPRAYVYRAALSAGIDCGRRAGARREESLDALDQSNRWSPADHRGPLAVLESAELVSEIEAALAELPAPRRAAVRLHLDGFDREEIARELGWTHCKARNLVYRGLKTLRARLQARGVAPQPARQNVLGDLVA